MSVSGDRDVQVGQNISLCYIFLPSYSPHCINTNVGGNCTADEKEKQVKFKRLNEGTTKVLFQYH